MDDLIKYLGQYDHKFPQRIEGAPACEIARLQELAGLEFPGEYRSFLNLMGRNTGSVPLLNDGTSDIRQLIHFYDEAKQDGEPTAPPDCLAIAIAGTLISEVYLKACGSMQCAVAWGEDPGNWGIMAESLSNRLFHSAFLYVNIEPPHTRFEHLRSYSTNGKTRRLEAIASHLIRLGMHVHDCSDRYNICAECHDAAVVAQHWEKSKCWLFVASASPKKAKMIGDSFGADYGFKTVKNLVKPKPSLLA